jgi:hypothetical protein
MQVLSKSPDLDRSRMPDNEWLRHCAELELRRMDLYLKKDKTSLFGTFPPEPPDQAGTLPVSLCAVPAI